MKRSFLLLTALAICGLWAGAASAAHPYRDRHFHHYGLHDAFDLQDFNRHSYAAGYPATWWSREATIEQVTPVPPLGQLPPVLMPPYYEWRRRSYEYTPRLLPAAVYPDTSPSDVQPPATRPGTPGYYERLYGNGVTRP
jgi:hypothetical protein